MVGDLQDLKRRIATHFKEDDLPPDIVRELAGYAGHRSGLSTKLSTFGQEGI